MTKEPTLNTIDYAVQSGLEFYSKEHLISWVKYLRLRVEELSTLRQSHGELVEELNNSKAALDCAINFLEEDCDYGVQDLKPSAIWLPKIIATRDSAHKALTKNWPNKLKSG